MPSGGTSFETLYDTVQKQAVYRQILDITRQKLDKDKKRGKIVAMKKTSKAAPRPVKRRVRQRLNPDSRAVLIAAVMLVSLLMVSSFAVSFSGIYTVSEWTGLPAYLQWLPALFIDAAIIAYTISLIVFKARGDSTWRTVLGLVGFAGISVIANVAHTLAYWNGELADFRAWIGVLITAAAPIAVLLAAEEVARLAFAKPKKK